MDANEINDYFTHVAGPISCFSAIVCGIAAVSNYCFPQQRKFPNIVLVWTVVADFFAATYISLRWLDGPLKPIYTAKIVPGSVLCHVTIYFDLAVQMSSSMVGVIVAYTLHATIIRNVDFEIFEHAEYYKIVGLFWGVTLLFPLFSLIDLHASTQGVGYCTLTTTLGTLLMITPWFVLFAVQLRYMIPVFVYMAKIKYLISTQCTTTSIYTRGQIWLYVKNVYKFPVSNAHIRLIGVTTLFLALNGFIVLVGNRSLKEFILAKADSFCTKWRSVVTTSEEELS